MVEFDNYVLGFVPYSIKEVQLNFQRWAYLVVIILFSLLIIMLFLKLLKNSIESEKKTFGEWKKIEEIEKKIKSNKLE